MKALLNKEVDFSLLAKENNQTISASLLTLEKVVVEKIHFNIPIYQRLYVWEINQIQTLLEDLKKAFSNAPEDSYFLGGIMLSNGANGKIDLVDGQQRFTTLWLICDALSESNSDLKNFTFFGEEPRIHFSIREKAQEYLKNQYSFKKYLNEKGEVSKGVEADISEIIPLVTGRKTIINLLTEFKKKGDFDSNSFGKYIFSKVHFSQTFIPIKSDMNRVFEAMNNRGKQLEHHQLLKSKLLEVVSAEKRLTYSLLWDACSDMNSYIEKSIKDVADISWKDLFSNFEFLHEGENEEIIKKTKYKLDALNIVEFLNKKSSAKEKEKSLLEILKDSLDDEPDKKKTEKKEITENEYFSKKIRSIISFPTFLLHTLRIYQANKNDANNESSDVNEKKLIENFDVKKCFNNEEKVTDFINLLWKLRILFDRYVIKWVYNDQNKEEQQSIENIQISKSIITNLNGSKNEAISIQRTENTDYILKDLIVLQSMLYHSQEMITQYWLTPFLHYLLECKFKNNEDILDRLEFLDNELFYTADSSKLKDRTYNVIFRDRKDYFKNLKNTENYLKTADGTNYPNYIFYKLEYILWKNREKLCDKYQLNKDKWHQYRMTAKNSVEHVFPQNSKRENEHIKYLSDDKFNEFSDKKKNPLDDFGNLVLISPGINSEYSNKSYQEKKGKFDSKKDIDSLKSALIFKEVDWNYNTAIFHRDEMIELVDNYMDSNKEKLNLEFSNK